LAQNRLVKGGSGVTFVHQARSEDEVLAHLDGGAMPGARWYCIQTEYRKEAWAAQNIEFPRKEIIGGFDPNPPAFAVFRPLVIVERRHGRKSEIVPASMFPGYLFARFSVEQSGWKAIATRPGVRRIFGSHPERPTPVPDAAIKRMMALGYDRPITEDPRTLFDPIPPGATVEVLDGAWTDHRGVCLWDDGKRARLAMQLFGRELEVQVERHKVRAL